MIKFRQKNFAAFLAALAPAVISGAAGIAGAKKSSESQEEIARKQRSADRRSQVAQEAQAKKDRELEEKKMKMAEKQEKRIEKIAKRDPQAAASIQPTVTVSTNNNQQDPQQANYSIGIDNIMTGVGTVGNVAGAVGGLRQTKVQTASDLNVAKMNTSAQNQATAASLKQHNEEHKEKMKELDIKARENKNSYKLAKQSMKLSRKTGNTAPKQVSYSVKINTKEAGGFVKNIGTLAKERGLHKALAGAVVGGAVSGGASYLIDKSIQKDVRKSGNFKLGIDNLSDEEKLALKKKRNRKLLATVGTTAALAGGAIAAKKGAFGANVQGTANKYISKDTARGIGNTFKESTKDYFTHVDPNTGQRKANTLNLALTGVSLAAPAVMYRMKKKQYQDQVRQSEGAEGERNYSKNTGGISFQNIGKQFNGIFKGNTTAYKMKSPGGKNSGINFKSIGKQFKGTLANVGKSPNKPTGGGTNKPKSYSPGPLEKTSRTLNFRQQLTKKAEPLKESWKEFKKHPGESVLGKASQLTGGGGRSGVSKFGEDLESLGVKSGNVTSQKVGAFIRENPKAALAGSIVVGGVVVKKAKDKAGGLASKALETVDPNAYAYSKYGAQPIVRGRRASNNLEEEEENG